MLYNFYKSIFVFFVFGLFSVIYLFLGCEKNSTSLTKQNLILSEDFAGVTEAWLNVRTGNIDLPVDFHLLRDDSLVLQGQLKTTDTTLIDTLLLPTHSYNYQLLLYKNGELSALSNELSITTMDTTSHDFQWTSYTFGGYSGTSYFSDVSIINENDIWAVGGIYGDSINQDMFYNAIRWNGSQWELHQIYVNYHSQPTLTPLEGSFALPDGNIVFSSGLPYLPEGDHWKLYHLWDMGILGQSDGGVPIIWGISLINLYFVGRIGTIVQYNGTNWHKIESGTDLPIQDVWGSQNPSSGETEILAVASDLHHNLGNELIRIQGLQTGAVPDSGLPWSINGVWFIPGRMYYIAGDGLFYARHLGTSWHQVSNQPLIYKTGIRGQAINDIFVVGSFGLISHFNGYSWHHYGSPEVPYFNGRYFAVALKEDLVMAVGKGNGQVAIILKGIRSH